MQFFTHDDFEGDAADRFEKANNLRERSHGLQNEIAEKFGSEPDVSAAKIDYMMFALCKAGVITKDQYTEMILTWERDLNSQLQSMRDTLQNTHDKRMADHRAAQAAAKKKQIATPPKGIVLPGGRVHEVPPLKE